MVQSAMVRRHSESFLHERNGAIPDIRSLSNVLETVICRLALDDIPVKLPSDQNTLGTECSLAKLENLRCISSRSSMNSHPVFGLRQTRSSCRCLEFKPCSIMRDVVVKALLRRRRRTEHLTAPEPE